jgi:amino-acid N-acetyltransferase
MTTIRSARSADLPALLTLLAHSGLPTAGLAEHLGTALVAEDGAGLVGSAALEVYGAEALLRSVAVSPELRGTGLGQRLVTEALDHARQLGVTSVYLLTESAAGFFPRFGFRPIERAAIPAAVQQSVEFTSACPASAQAMAVPLSPMSEAGAPTP